ncbi:MAG TPA: metallophosphoesterase [Ktedonobacterales bacterium]|jgi:predicted phosphodiesterase
MTRIVITSDLHLGISGADEIAALVEAIAAERPDLTVIAGDIGEGEANVRACLDLFRGLPGQVAALGGNHDVWALSAPWRAGGPGSQELWERTLPEAAREAGMLWLEEEDWRSGGLAVAGSIAWYDYTGAAEDIPPQTEEYWRNFKRTVLPNGRLLNPDAKFINWPWSDVEFASARADALVKRMGALESDPGVEDILLVTHVPIFREQLIIRADVPNWGYGNAFFGNMTLGARLRGSPKLRAVVSGHTHIGRTETLADEQATPVWVIPSDFHAPRYVVYEHPGGELRGQDA